MKRYVLLKDGIELAAANKCAHTQAVLFSLLMIAQAFDENLKGMGWEFPASQANRIGRIYGWEGRHDTLYGMPIRWTAENEA